MDENAQPEFKADQPTAEPVEVSRPKPRTGCAWSLLSLVVFLSALALLSGPDLVVSASDALGGGTWSVRRPQVVVPLFEYEIYARENLSKA